jgi:hypothetical protein
MKIPVDIDTREGLTQALECIVSELTRLQEYKDHLINSILSFFNSEDYVSLSQNINELELHIDRFSECYGSLDFFLGKLLDKAKSIVEAEAG